MLTIERELKEKIMTTDIYFSISSDIHSEKEINRDIDLAILQLKHFEINYSRFKNGNILDKLNKSAEIKVEEEFLRILVKAKSYYLQTKGIFDPSILKHLKKEGYRVSKTKGYFIEDTKNKYSNEYNFNDIEILLDQNIIKKPIELEIDLGGIGKGYMVEKITTQFKNKYKNFCVNLGGDMYVAGTDQQNKYPYWGIEIENPFKIDIEMPLLILKDKAIATSGINKRNWLINSQTKNHLINPNTKKSVENNLICATIIDDNPISADIYAKTAVILGEEEGMKFCNEHKLPVVFITKEKKIIIGDYAKKYIWKDD